MTIATATVTVGPAAGSIAGGVYGVGIYAGTLGAGAFPLIGTVSYASGPTETVLFRDGIFYAFEEQATSVEVVTADGSTGTLLVDRARSPRDFVNLAVPVALARVNAALAPATVAAGTYAADATLATFTKPGADYDSFALIQTAGDRPYFQLAVTYGADSWAWNSTLVASVPCLYALISPGDGRAVAGVGLVVPGGAAQCFPAPDAIRFAVNAGGPVFISGAGMSLLGIWWRAAG